MLRPYFNLSGQQLTELFESCNGDQKILYALRDELQHRKTPKMEELRRLVSVEIAAIEVSSGTQKEPASRTPHQKTNRQRDEPRPPESDYDADRDAGEQDEIRGGKLGSIRPCGPHKDVPPRWVFPQKRDFTLDVPADADRLVRFVAAIRALISDMRRKGSGMRTVALEGGEAVTLDGHERGYQFRYDGEAELFEGAKITLSVGGRSLGGRIVAVSNQTLTISVDDDLGNSIGACLLKIDNTAMIEALADRLEKVRKGEASLNLAMAEDVIANSSEEQLPGHVPAYLGSDLNARQREAVGRSLTNSVTYLWGPPGTGKTKSLSIITQLLFDANKRILICSNTNQAVDQVLLKLCETLGLEHSAMVDGRILRLGQIHHAELARKFGEYVTLDGIVTRKSAHLKKRKVELEDETNRRQRNSEGARLLIERFKRLDEAERQCKELINGRQALEQVYRDSIADVRIRDHRLSELERELYERSIAGTLRRLLLRSEHAITKDIAEARTAKQASEQSAEKYQQELASDERRRLEAQTTIDCEKLREALVGGDRIIAQKEVDDADEKIQSLNQEMAEINRQLEALEKSIVADARILGATVTKTYLSPQLFGNFDVVIIDEASMILLPAIFYAGGFAKEKVIVSGDFRQLSPIVPTDQAAILDVIGFDVFRAAGISEAFTKKAQLKRTVMLEQQYRMTDGICRLISPRIYNGRLKTVIKQDAPCFPLPAPFDGELTIIDTSPIQPFVSRHGTSRYNLIQALAIRNLTRYLRESGFIDGDMGRLGICTPFAAQKEVLARVLKAWGLNDSVEVGTVHRYQGDEKVSMIIDIPDSLGERYVGIFAQAEHPEDDGCKLFNVAVSRAKAHLIFVANLSYLDRKLPANAFLREILHSVQGRGRTVDVRDVLAMWPIADELRSLGYPIPLDPEAQRSGLFQQADFEAVCHSDIRTAKSSVAIFSGFITPQRVVTYEALFRGKLAEGVAIRCVTRPPTRNGNIPEDLGCDALDGLEAMGCIVDTRWDIHQKVVIIDDEVVWIGSLNPLSHTSRTDEVMMRFTSRPIALQLSAFMAVGNTVNPDKAEGLSVTRENPKCANCGGRTTYRTGSYGPFWQCESKCGWTESVGKARKGEARASDVPKKGPACPLCKSPTVLRAGRYGEFYGCTQYPVCNGKIDAKGAKPTRKKEAKVK